MFGRDPELSFDVVVPGADVAAVTMPVLDRPRSKVVRQHGRLLWKARMTRPCDVHW